MSHRRYGPSATKVGKNDLIVLVDQSVIGRPEDRHRTPDAALNLSRNYCSRDPSRCCDGMRLDGEVGKTP